MTDHIFMTAMLPKMEGDELDAHLDRVLVGGREKRRVVIVDYDPIWPERFDQEKTRISSAVGRTALRIEHVGSTAVPGLAAKPVVDIVLVVDDVEDEASYHPPLERVGYVLRVREPGHRMFRTPELDVHIHVWPVGSAEIERLLLFRDWLRIDEDDRRAYEAVKRGLAEREWVDLNHYANAKGGLIADIMTRARAWAETCNWTP